MRVLLANDDGIEAAGITALRQVLEDLDWEVYVSAPDRERSAVGHGITVHRPLRVRKYVWGEKSRGWSVDGTPADCVKLALENFLPQPPDLVISGINLGPNLGTDVLYSGTVSAAFEGLINGFTAIAVSLAVYGEADYRPAAAFLRDFLPQALRMTLPPCTMLNINVPPGVPRGIRIARLGRRRYVNVFHRRTDPRGRAYYWMAGEVEDTDNGPGTDLAAVKDGFVSVSPLHCDLTDYNLLDALRDLENS
ncbi:MAG: 5'/3'-nucleotidase SurE [Peptococcaceae bacterium]|jgi:5'-nucleotidase|nr:5'/3'-nucleotidase SurE [Peptococcaceae bacterium]